jgi:hypothetical protein
VKEALDTFRGLARETLGRIRNFELKQVDTELERMLPALGEAYHRVREATVAHGSPAGDSISATSR